LLTAENAAQVKGLKSARLRCAKANRAAMVGPRKQDTLLPCTPFTSDALDGSNQAGSGYLGLIVISTAASGPRTLRSSA
jgi:hypothetical protein